MKERKEIELLAPAGSYDSLVAAAQGGANAIYFGIEQLNMRARSSANFTAEDLPRIVEQAGEAGMKTYLTVNTVVFNHELQQMRKIVDLALQHQVTAIIASDQSVLQYCHSVGVRVHLSTQLNISNIESLKFYSSFADVAVLARELDLEQVREIQRERVSMSFNVRAIAYDPPTDKVFVTGIQTTSGPGGKPVARTRTYELIVGFAHYRPVIRHLDVYPDEPRLGERGDPLPAPQAPHRSTP